MTRHTGSAGPLRRALPSTDRRLQQPRILDCPQAASSVGGWWGSLSTPAALEKHQHWLQARAASGRRALLCGACGPGRARAAPHTEVTAHLTQEVSSPCIRRQDTLPAPMCQRNQHARNWEAGDQGPRCQASYWGRTVFSTNGSKLLEVRIRNMDALALSSPGTKLN